MVNIHFTQPRSSSALQSTVQVITRLPNKHNNLVTPTGESKVTEEPKIQQNDNIKNNQGYPPPTISVPAH